MSKENEMMERLQAVTCCVTGHRRIPKDQVAYVKQALQSEVDKALKDGYTHFISGFAEGVDQYFTEIIAEKRQENEKLHLEAAIPYRSRIAALCKNPETMRLLFACTVIGIHSEAYDASCFMKRNRFMVSHSSRVIAVYDGREKSGTAATMRMAVNMGKQIREISIKE